MTDRNWITRVAAKVGHHDGSVYCGYLTPSEIVALHENHYVQPAPGSKLSDWVCKKRDTGQSNPMWHYFLIRKGTPFAEAVSARIPNKR